MEISLTSAITRIYLRIIALGLCILGLLPASFALAQERSQYQYWLDLAAADQRYADRGLEVGRRQAFLEFLGEGSVIFRDGPLAALAVYSDPDF